MKKLIHLQTNQSSHWVGDGFPVRSMFTYNDLGQKISPFLLMDYGGPAKFEPSEHIRGVGPHPHRGFETVTIVYEGEIEHRDSSGGGGLIRPGDVQWMTAASGILHEEFHGKDFSQKGGAFEMVQLWVNLPQKDKSAPPRYQNLTQKNIPQVILKEGAGLVRVIAGEFEGTQGAALTFTPINLWDIRLKSQHEVTFHVPEGQTATIFILSGHVVLNDGSHLKEAELGVLENAGDSFTITAQADSKILFMGGEPIREPVVGYGPFVMNSVQEIHQAFQDFQSGKFGKF